MQTSWQSCFLDALLDLDVAEGPHGLYGVQYAHMGPSTTLPTMAQVLLSPERTNFVAKIGCKDARSDARQNKLSLLTPESHWIEMRVLDHASTKVRRFGSAYRLDTYHRKPSAAPGWDLHKLIPKLGEPKRRGFPRASTLTQTILLVAHGSDHGRLRALVAEAAEESFLQRYAVSLVQREWEDRYQRGFCSGLYLWSA